MESFNFTVHALYCLNSTPFISYIPIEKLVNIFSNTIIQYFGKF